MYIQDTGVILLEWLYFGHALSSYQRSRHIRILGVISRKVKTALFLPDSIAGVGIALHHIRKQTSIRFF